MECPNDGKCIDGKCINEKIQPCQNKPLTNDGKCKCGKSKTCDLRAPFCDLSLNENTGGCKCSANVEACKSASVDRCLEKKCSCGKTGHPCEKETPICVNGLCSKEPLQKSASFSLITITQ